MSLKLNKIRFEVALAEKAMTLKELSTVSGVPLPTIITVRQNDNRGTPKTIGRLAKALEVPVTELIEKED